MKHGFFRVIAILSLFAVLAGCGGSGSKKAEPSAVNPSPAAPQVQTPAPAPAKVEGKVVIYSSASQDILKLITPALKAKYPDLEVQWVYGGTEDLVDKLNAEFAAGSVGADAIMMADPAYARLLKSQGLLLPYIPTGVSRVKVDRDPEGYYTGVRVIDVVIIYNPDLVKTGETPKSFKDLLEPKWKGQVAMSDPTKSGTSFATVGALVNTYGWEYFQSAQDNQWQVGGSSSSPAKKVSEGKAKVGLSVESTFRSEKAKGAKLDMVWPTDGAIVLESPYAILKGAKNVAGAKVVVDWLLTDEAQRIFTQGQMHPVISGVTPPAGSLTLDEILKQAMKVNWDKLATEKGETQDKFVKMVQIKA